jgi:hypothetical protein
MGPLYQELNTLIAQYGTKRVLEELINNFYGETDYIVRVKKDLEVALAHYEARYNPPESLSFPNVCSFGSCGVRLPKGVQFCDQHE